MTLLFEFVLTIKLPCVVAVKYEARLDDGTLVAKSDEVEFTVKEGQCEQILSWSMSLVFKFSYMRCLT
jgi:hypothetical protein